MRGRGDKRFQPQGGGRGRFVKKQGEPYKGTSKLGMKPEVGAYLDLPRGKPADPDMVLHWLDCLRVYIISNYESGITEIIGGDGSLNEYPELEEPEEPDDDAGPVQMENWKTEKREYRKALDTFNKDCLKVFGLFLGQMSEGSRNRIKESPLGPKALADRDPLNLLSVVVTTHMNNKRYGDNYNIIAAEIDFFAHKMLHNEDLLKYYTRFKTLLFVRSEAYRVADVDCPDMSDELQSTKFIVGLSSVYLEYVNLFRNKTRPWPLSLDEAQADASNYVLGKPGGQTQNPPNQERRNVLAASRGGKGGSGGRGGRGGQGEKGERGGLETQGARSGTPYRDREASPLRDGTVQEYGTRYGKCNNCSEEGHYAYECKKPKGSVKKSAAAWNASSEK
jgi:Zinc knuckle